MSTQRNRGASYLEPKETKTFSKTSEFFVWLIVAAVILLVDVVSDDFNQETAWTLVTWLSVAYILSRGIAKAGARKSDLEGVASAGDPREESVGSGIGGLGLGTKR